MKILILTAHSSIRPSYIFLPHITTRCDSYISLSCGVVHSDVFHCGKKDFYMIRGCLIECRSLKQNMSND